MKTLKWVIALVVLAALLAGGYGLFQRLTSTPEEAGGEETVEVQQGNLVLTAAAFGSISLPQKVKLSFPTAGTLAEVGVRVGDKVTQDQVLARLDEGPLRQAVLQAQVGLKNAELALKNVEEPYPEEDIAGQEAAVAEAQRAVELARQEVPIVRTTGERSVADAQEALDKAKAAVAEAQRAVELARQEVPIVQTTGERSVADAQEALDKAKAPYSEDDVAAARAAVAEAQRAVELAQQEVPIVRTTGERSVADAQEALDPELDSYRSIMLRYLGEELSDEELLMKPRVVYFSWVTELPEELEDAYDGLMKVKERLDLARLQADKSLQAAQNAVAKAEETLRQAQVRLADMTPDSQEVEKARRNLDLAQLQADKSLQAAQNAVAKAGETLRQAQANLAQVEAGQGVELAQLQADKSSQAAQNAVTKAEETLRQAQARLAEMKSGADPEEIAPKELQVSQARLSLEEAESNLGAARLVAPFSGVVAEAGTEAGDRVAAGTQVVVLVDPSQVEVSATVDEVDVARVEAGQPAVITLDALPGARLRGRVKSISPVAQVQAGVVSYPVVISILSGEEASREDMTRGGDQPRQAVAAPGGMATDIQPREGMSASVEIVVEMRQDVLLVPSRAVRSVGGQRVVSVKAEQGVEERPVEVGLTDGRNTEIISGLKEGDTVVLPVSSGVTPGPGGGGIVPVPGGGRMFR